MVNSGFESYCLESLESGILKTLVDFYDGVDESLSGSNMLYVVYSRPAFCFTYGVICGLTAGL